MIVDSLAHQYAKAMKSSLAVSPRRAKMSDILALRSFVCNSKGSCMMKDSRAHKMSKTVKDNAIDVTGSIIGNVTDASG